MSTYTANELREALNCTKRAVLLAIRGTPATETRIVRGQRAGAWDFPALPAVMQTKLETAALAKGFRNAAALLNHLATEPTPEQPEPASAVPEINRELRARATEAIECVNDPGKLTAKEREYVWGQICETFEALNLPPGEAVVAKRALSVWLDSHAPGLASSVRTIERKLAHPDKRADARLQRSGNFRDKLCPACLEKLLQLNLALGGRESHAWREMKKKGLLCPDCDSHHTFNIRKYKSRVPDSIRNRLTPITDKALPFAKSDSAGRMAGPKLNLTYDHMSPGDWLVADDVSWNHEVWTVGPDGRPYLCRPECLYMADERTSYPIHFILKAGEPGKKASYNGNDVRRLMLEAHDKVGLPRRGYAFENGVWRSRGVRDEQAGQAWMEWAETELGFKTLQDFVEIRHTQARTPTGKPTIEGDFRILQENMRTLPGFVGFNERAEKTDRVKRLEADFRRRVKEGEHPGNEFMSLTQFAAKLNEVLWDFANEPQNGKRLPGSSPLEAWGTPALRKLPDEARWILATRRELLKVGGNGLVVKGHSYANEELRRYIGEFVWAFYNIEYPRLLTVCDRKRTHYFSITELTAPARTASDTPEGRAELARSCRQIADFNGPAKIIAGSIPHPSVITVEHDSDANEAHRKFGRHINAGVKQDRKQQGHVADARRRQAQEASRLERSAMMQLSSDDNTIVAPL